MVFYDDRPKASRGDTRNTISDVCCISINTATCTESVTDSQRWVCNARAVRQYLITADTRLITFGPERTFVYYRHYEGGLHIDEINLTTFFDCDRMGGAVFAYLHHILGMANVSDGHST